MELKVSARVWLWVCSSCGSWVTRPGKDNEICPWCGGHLDRVEKEYAE